MYYQPKGEPAALFTPCEALAIKRVYGKSKFEICREHFPNLIPVA